MVGKHATLHQQANPKPCSRLLRATFRRWFWVRGNGCAEGHAARHRAWVRSPRRRDGMASGKRKWGVGVRSALHSVLPESLLTASSPQAHRTRSAQVATPYFEDFCRGPATLRNVPMPTYINPLHLPRLRYHILVHIQFNSYTCPGLTVRLALLLFQTQHSCPRPRIDYPALHRR